MAEERTARPAARNSLTPFVDRPTSWLVHPDDQGRQWVAAVEVRTALGLTPRIWARTSTQAGVVLTLRPGQYGKWLLLEDARKLLATQDAHAQQRST